MTKRINCLGILVVDALSGPLAAYPIPGKRPAAITPHIRFMPGGGAANTASALSRMGLNAGVFSKVGADANGSFLISDLRKKGVDVSGIAVSRKETTPFTFVGIHASGDRTFIHTPGSNLTLSAKDVDTGSFLNADFVVYPDLFVLPRMDGRPIADLFRKARRQGVRTFLDECYGLGPRRGAFEAVLPQADFALPSFHDLQAIYPARTPDAMIRLLRRKGARNIVLKAGPDGCYLAPDGGAIRHIPSRVTKIVDTTGAGDCFNAGFLAGLLKGFPMEEAADIGAWCAAAKIGHVGGASGIPRFAELTRRLRHPSASSSHHNQTKEMV